MKTTIDTKELASLSRLSFSDNELEGFQRDMENIKSFFQKVSQCCEGNMPLKPQGKNVLREDVPKDFDEQDMILSLSPSATDEGYRVLKVVEG